MFSKTEIGKLNKKIWRHKGRRRQAMKMLFRADLTLSQRTWYEESVVIQGKIVEKLKKLKEEALARPEAIQID